MRPNCSCSSRTSCSLETRPENSEGLGDVSQRDLVRNALRMRPDRIILGETRGAEAFDMLQAMNTGHDGSMTTIHANTPRDAHHPAGEHGDDGEWQSAADVDPPADRKCGAPDRADRAHARRHAPRTHVTEIAGMEGDVIITQDLFTFRYTASAYEGQVRGVFEGSSLRPAFAQRAAY